VIYPFKLGISSAAALEGVCVCGSMPGHLIKAEDAGDAQEGQGETRQTADDDDDEEEGEGDAGWSDRRISGVIMWLCRKKATRNQWNR